MIVCVGKLPSGGLKNCGGRHNIHHDQALNHFGKIQGHAVANPAATIMAPGWAHWSIGDATKKDGAGAGAGGARFGATCFGAEALLLESTFVATARS